MMRHSEMWLTSRDPVRDQAREQVDRELERARDAVASQERFFRDQDREGSSMLEKLLTPLLTLGGAVATGWVAGRTGTTAIGSTGIPAGLAAGAVGHTLALAGVLPKRAVPYVQAFSNGAIAGWGALWGVGQGNQGAINAGRPVDQPITAGVMPYMAPSPAPRMFAPSVSQYVPRPRTSPLSEAEVQGIQAHLRRAA